MTGIGSKLKEARLKQNKSLQEIEDVTKIRTKYLQALEDENFSILPGSIYIKGFLRTYAKVLGIDAQELIEIYEDIEDPVQEKEVLTGQQADTQFNPPSNRKYVKVILSIMAILTLIGLQKIYPTIIQQFTPSQPPNVGQIDEQEPDLDYQEPTDGNDISDEDEEEIVDRLVLKIEIMEQSCWVRVYGDGQIVYEKTMNKDEEIMIEAKESLSFTLGNAGVAKVHMQDEDLGILGHTGEVISRDFRIEDYQ